VLVRRAAEVYLGMIFRDGIYHADPHPGNCPRAMNERTDLKGTSRPRRPAWAGLVRHRGYEAVASAFARA
jgi:hypothetical protein